MGRALPAVAMAGCSAMADTPEPWRNRADPRNGSAYQVGHTCIEMGCEQPAGTAWSPYWCFEHNVERIERITQQLAEIKQGMAP